MSAQAIRLTEAKIKNAKPLEKDYVMGDGDGLQFRVRTNGSKLWNFNYYHPITKKRLNMGLGAYPGISLAQARKMTLDARELIATGVDPKDYRSGVQQQQRAATGESILSWRW